MQKNFENLQASEPVDGAAELISSILSDYERHAVEFGLSCWVCCTESR